MSGLKVLLMGGVVKEYHNFSVMGPILKELLAQWGYEVTATEDPDYFLAENIRDFDCIIAYTTHGELSSAQEEGLLNAIIGSPWGNTGKPKGFIGLHGASCSFENSQAYLRMLGGHFLAHPEMGTELKIKVKNKKHPVTLGVKDFSIIDEFYMMEAYPPFETLLSADYQGFELPLAWVKPYGLGRVFYIALGHGAEQISHPAFQRLLRQAVHWTTNLS